MSYKIIRLYTKGNKRKIDSGLTLDEAQTHCRNSESSSRTCVTPQAKAITRRNGEWFDGYEEE